MGQNLSQQELPALGLKQKSLSPMVKGVMHYSLSSAGLQSSDVLSQDEMLRATRGPAVEQLDVSVPPLHTVKFHSNLLKRTHALESKHPLQ
jgi:hypothetical protein